GTMAVKPFVFLLEGFLEPVQPFGRELHALEGEPDLRRLTQKSDIHVTGEVDQIGWESFAPELDEHRLAHLVDEGLESVNSEVLASKLATARVMVFDAAKKQSHRAEQARRGRDNCLFNT